MNRLPHIALLFAAVLLVQSRTTLAHGPLRKALKAKYDFKSVSCYTCHSREDDIVAEDLAAFEMNKKAFLNPFGKQLGKLLDGKDITKRMAEVEELESDYPQKKMVIGEVTKEFLEALMKLESVKSPSGTTYGELLKQGTLDGVKPRGFSFK